MHTRINLTSVCVAGGKLRMCVFEGIESLRAAGELVWMCFWRLTVGGALALFALDVKFDFEAFGNWVIMMDTKRMAQPRVLKSFSGMHTITGAVNQTWSICASNIMQNYDVRQF